MRTSNLFTSQLNQLRQASAQGEDFTWKMGMCDNGADDSSKGQGKFPCYCYGSSVMNVCSSKKFQSDSKSGKKWHVPGCNHTTPRRDPKVSSRS